VLGLLALLLLIEARRPARLGAGGELVPLTEQDRSLWDRTLVAEGHDLVRRCLRRNQPGPFQIQAAINAVHTDGAATDWRQVLALYDQLLALAPTPIVALNRAAAIAERDGPAAGLAEVDAVPGLDGYPLFHAARAELLARLGRDAAAGAAYDEALALVTNETERAYLRARRSGLDRRPFTETT